MASSRKPNKAVRKDGNTPKTTVNWVAVLKALGAILTLIIAAAGVWVAVQAQRASLSVVEVTFTNGLVAQKKIEPRLTIKNSGNSTAIVAALNVTNKITTRGLSSLPADPEYMPGGDIGPLSMLPDTAVKVTAHPQPAMALKNEYSVSLFEVGDKRLHVYGFISYRDTFSTWGSMTTAFCFVYTPTPSGHFEPCAERNYTFPK